MGEFGSGERRKEQHTKKQRKEKTNKSLNLIYLQETIQYSAIGWMTKSCLKPMIFDLCELKVQITLSKWIIHEDHPNCWKCTAVQEMSCTDIAYPKIYINFYRYKSLNSKQKVEVEYNMKFIKFIYVTQMNN